MKQNQVQFSKLLTNPSKTTKSLIILRATMSRFCGTTKYSVRKALYLSVGKRLERPTVLALHGECGAQHLFDTLALLRALVLAISDGALLPLAATDPFPDVFVTHGCCVGDGGDEFRKDEVC
jgi:hypothetical protein